MKSLRYALIGPLIVIMIWTIVSSIHLIDSFFLPSPISVFSKLLQLMSEGTILPDLVMTLERIFSAFLIALIIGIPLGLVLGASRKGYEAFGLVIDFFRSIPATAIFPLFLLIFGIGDESKVAVAASASALIIIFNTAQGIRNSSKVKSLAAKLMGANRIQIFRKILFWESLPQIFIGIRTALSLTLIIIVVTEMFIGTNGGLGKRIVDYQIVYEVTSMYAVILLTGIVGYLLNWMVALLEKRVVHWAGK